MDIEASSNRLRLSYPPSRAFPRATEATGQEELTLHIGAIPFFDLDSTSFLPCPDDGNDLDSVSCAFPGLNVTLRGNIIRHVHAQGRTRELTFSKKQKRYGAYHYVLRWMFDRQAIVDAARGDEEVVPEMVIEFEQTALPECSLRM